MDLGVTIGDQARRIETIGDAFSFVEVGIGEGAAIPGEQSPAAIREMAQSVDCTITVHLPFKQELVTHVPELNQAIISYLGRLLHWAGRIDARYAVVHATARHPNDTSLRPIMIDQLGAISEIAQGLDITVTLENVGHQPRGLPLSVVADLADEAEVPLCFDIGHAYMEGGNDAIERVLNQYNSQIVYLHLHDVRSRGDTHLPIGAGEIDFSILQAAWEEMESDVALEIFTDDRGHLLDSATRFRKLIGEE